MQSVFEKYQMHNEVIGIHNVIQCTHQSIYHIKDLYDLDIVADTYMLFPVDLLHYLGLSFENCFLLFFCQPSESSRPYLFGQALKRL